MRATRERCVKVASSHLEAQIAFKVTSPGFSAVYLFTIISNFHLSTFSTSSSGLTFAMDDDTTNKHLRYLSEALELAKKSPPKPTNFCVGALLLDTVNDKVLSTGYTLELPGNTHAEQCCLSKLAQEHNLSEEEVGKIIPEHAVLYTTMEPCFVRLSGNLPCVQRVLQTSSNGYHGIKSVVCGVKEPETFVGENKGRKALADGGVDVIYVTGLEDEILKVATAGHRESS
ncbi:cytidine deaminase-like protein [Microthyrium microscopicum]|uniref:Cytidine deaminase-like protein n=1 Tax=Microthyrium microscopicum TaxID=703497 RepID=A0A6A6UUT2_9PEZI|nr:cytidine deaminase-like protein [Microthyrium microscopicum]